MSFLRSGINAQPDLIASYFPRKQKIPSVAAMLAVFALLAAACVVDESASQNDDREEDGVAEDTQPVRQTATSAAPSTTAPATTAPATPGSSISRDGLYSVGVDVAPGRYLTQGQGSSCYFEVLSDVSGGLDSIVKNHFGNALGQRVQLEAGQFFDTKDCGTWALEGTAGRAATPGSSISRDGLYSVGVDVAPGRYLTQGQGSSCYFEVLSDVSGGLDSIVKNHFGNALGQRVQLEAGQFFDTNDCGTWALEGTAGR